MQKPDRPSYTIAFGEKLLKDFCKKNKNILSYYERLEDLSCPESHFIFFFLTHIRPFLSKGRELVETGLYREVSSYYDTVEN